MSNEMIFDHSPKPVEIVEMIDETAIIREQGVPGMLASANSISEAWEMVRNGYVKFRNGTTVEEKDVD
jgi:hypothetical protein